MIKDSNTNLWENPPEHNPFYNPWINIIIIWCQTFKTTQTGLLINKDKGDNLTIFLTENDNNYLVWNEVTINELHSGQWYFIHL